MSMAERDAGFDEDVAEHPARKPDETIAVFAANFRKSRRLIFEYFGFITVLRYWMRLEVLRLRLRNDMVQP